MNGEVVFELIKDALLEESSCDGKNEKHVNISSKKLTVTEEELSVLKKQGVETLVRGLIDRVDCDGTVKKEWDRLAAGSMVAYFRIITEQQHLTDLLIQENICPIILKGCSAAMYYPVPGYRLMGDIDVYIEKSKYEKACDILSRSGYQMVHGFDGRHCRLGRNGVIIELHKTFSTSSDAVSKNRFDQRLAAAANGAVLQTDGEHTWYSFPTLENGLILLEHMRHHLASGIGLRQLIDWMMFVHKQMDDPLWEQFGPAAKEYGLLKLSKTATKTCVKYLGLPDIYRWADDADDTLCDELISYIMNKGNLGKEKRDDNTRFIKVLNVSGYSLPKMLAYEQASGMSHWKAAKKYVVLRPFAWIYGIGHHIKELISDKEDLRSILFGTKESRKQRAMLKRLKD